MLSQNSVSRNFEGFYRINKVVRCLILDNAEGQVAVTLVTTNVARRAAKMHPHATY